MSDVNVIVSEAEEAATVLIEEEGEVALLVELPPAPSLITVSVPGPAGPQGPVGPQGPSGDLNYTHVQGAPSSEWSVLHGLGKFPSVTVVDSSGAEVMGDVLYVNDDLLTLSFTAPFSGEAYAN